MAPPSATDPKQIKVILNEPVKSASLPDTAVETIPDALVKVARKPKAVAVNLREKISAGKVANKISGIIIMRPTTHKTNTPM